MLYSITGKLIASEKEFIVIEAFGIGFKIFVPAKTKKPKIGSKIKVFCRLLIRREDLSLYGFLSEKEMEIFEMLNSVAGIGPRSTLKIMGGLKIEKFLSAVANERTDLLTGSWGIGRKKAQRIIIELKDKLDKKRADEPLEEVGEKDDIKNALKKLGYKEKEIEKTMNKAEFSDKEKLEDKIRKALKILGRKI